MEQVTNLLQRIELGDEQAVADLFPLVYDELRRLAKWHMNGEQRDHTLQPTALVNEVYVRLVGANHDMKVASRVKFFAAAAEAMRHILVDAARRKLSLKRGGNIEREFFELDRIVIARPNEVLAIHEALDALENEDAQCAELVKLHYFGGYSIEEIADQMNIGRSTANRWWKYARAWLRTHMESSGL